jgi:nucleotide-binding universal stress UspA family protein
LADTYIAPQLLEFEPPSYQWNRDQNLMLRYEYDFMPKGVVTQLIVRVYRWIEQQQLVWRSGVVFNDGRARAEVIEDYRLYKGEIRLRVAGVQNKRLLDILAHEIDEINASFEKIKVAKKVPCNCDDCRDSDDPYFFRLETLKRFLDKGRNDTICEKSVLDVNIRSLLAVAAPANLEGDTFDHQLARQAEIDRLKQQHIEYYAYDVFLAHNSQDKTFIRQIYQQLKTAGCDPWLDVEAILPGQIFQDEIQKAVQRIQAAAIFIGTNGLGRWEQVELRILISQCVDREIPVIPVLLPGVTDIPEDLLFLNQYQAVIFTSENDKDALTKLQRGITRQLSSDGTN